MPQTRNIPQQSPKTLKKDNFKSIEIILNEQKEYIINLDSSQYTLSNLNIDKYKQPAKLIT